MSELTVRRSIMGIGVAAIAITAGFVGRATLVSARPESARPAANVAVDCEPTQRAIVRQAVVDGESRVAIECATVARAEGAGRAASYASMQPASAMPAGEAMLVPAVYEVPAAAPARVTRPSATSAPRRAVSSTSVERPRSWQKRAVIIGGAAGAGAGIGALIGGKKGALIGAAVGGGSGTLYEIVRK